MKSFFCPRKDEIFKSVVIICKKNVKIFYHPTKDVWVCMVTQMLPFKGLKSKPFRINYKLPRLK